MVFQKNLHPCALDECSLSIERINIVYDICIFSDVFAGDVDQRPHSQWLNGKASSNIWKHRRNI